MICRAHPAYNPAHIYLYGTHLGASIFHLRPPAGAYDAAARQVSAALQTCGVHWYAQQKCAWCCSRKPGSTQQLPPASPRPLCCANANAGRLQRALPGGRLPGRVTAGPPVPWCCAAALQLPPRVTWRRPRTSRAPQGGAWWSSAQDGQVRPPRVSSSSRGPHEHIRAKSAGAPPQQPGPLFPVVS